SHLPSCSSSPSLHSCFFSFSFSFYSSAPPRDLHSFPTRRSSDLARATRPARRCARRARSARSVTALRIANCSGFFGDRLSAARRSEEHTSELQSLTNLVCRLLLEKKKKEHKRATLFMRQNMCEEH